MTPSVRPLLALCALAAACDLAEALNRKEGEACASIFECDDGLGLVCGGAGSCQLQGAPTTGELGDPCDERSHCRIEYDCHAAGACAPAGVLPAGSGCDLVNWCAPADAAGQEMACSFPVGGTIAGVCKVANQNAVRRGGGRCEKVEDCAEGGTQLVGRACIDSFDCALGLLCAPGLGGKACQKLPFYRGRRCDAAQADEGPLRALFVVSEDGQEPDEFYQAPFPADFRKNAAGFIDLTGHPHPSFRPANDLAPRMADMALPYMRHIEKTVRGFSTTAATYMRFSGRIDKRTLRGPGEGQTLHFVDVSQGPHRGEAVPFDHDYRQSRGKFICDNRLAVRPIDGYPLRPATAYAVFVTEGVRGRAGEIVGRDAHFRMMLAPTAPGDGPLKRAYDAFAPLRAHLAGAGIDPETVVTGTVFTTDDVHAVSRGMAARIEALDAPTVAADGGGPPLVALCTTGGQRTFCTDDGAGDEAAAALRSCGAPSDKFHEVHLKISVPIFQQGVAPYLVEGGDIELDEAGLAKVQRRESVCAALTVPKGVMPAGGWPVSLYGHGTGGWFSSFVGTDDEGHGVAADLAVLPRGAGFAVLGFDQVQHGPRRGGSDVSPESLFFNFLNPKAARDNTLQGAGDVISLVKFLKTAVIDVGGGVPQVRFNPAKVFYHGHSQGTVTGPPGVVFTDVPVVLMSGAGGNLVQSLLNKTQPVNIADGIRLAVADDGVDPFHEILNVLQHFIGPSDTINYGRQFFLEPPAGYPAKHVLHIYGKRDFFAPEANQRALAAAMGVTLLGPELTPIPGIAKQAAGTLSANADAAGGGKVTAGVVQYVPTRSEVSNDDGATTEADDYDGHFVSFHDDPSGGTVGSISGWRRYMESGLEAAAPEITR